jgi:membrane associated rhomboid family serine protease
LFERLRNPGVMMGVGPGLTPTVMALLAANITIFIVQFLLSPSALMVFNHTFGLVPGEAIPRLKLWQFASYMFLHGGFWHLFFNMFALWMFGSEIEALWGRQAFLRYYFVCGFGGGLTYAVTSWGSYVPLVGASGAVFGILLAYALLFPDRQILLYFLIPIKVKWFVLGYGLIELLAATRGSPSQIGHFAHLGGLLFGYLYLKLGMGHRATGAGWPRRRPRARIRVVPPQAPPPRSADQVRIDEILEKITREGLASLSDEEKDFLRRASRKH